MLSALVTSLVAATLAAPIAQVETPHSPTATDATPAADAAATIAKVRATYRALPKLTSSVTYVLNTAIEGLQVGTFGMGTQAVDADRSARTVLIRKAGEGGLEIALADGILRMGTMYAPEVRLAQPVEGSASAAPILAVLREVSKDGVVPLPLMYLEVSLYLDGDLGLPVSLDAFRAPTQEDEARVNRLRDIQTHPSFGLENLPTLLPLVAPLVAKEGESSYVLGVEPESGRVAVLIFRGNGDEIGLQPGPQELVLVLRNRLAETGGPPNAMPPASRELANPSEYARAVRRAYVFSRVPNPDEAESRLGPIERSLAALPVDNPQRRFAEQQLELARRLIAARRELAPTE